MMQNRRPYFHSNPDIGPPRQRLALGGTRWEDGGPTVLEPRLSGRKFRLAPRPPTIAGTLKNTPMIPLVRHEEILDNLTITFDRMVVGAGELLTGHVTFDVYSFSRLVGLEIHFLGGSVLTVWSSVAAAETWSGAVSPKLRRTHNLLTKRIHLVGNSYQEGDYVTLRPGSYSFKFSLPLPSELLRTSELQGFLLDNSLTCVTNYFAQAQLSLFEVDPLRHNKLVEPVLKYVSEQRSFFVDRGDAFRAQGLHQTISVGRSRRRKKRAMLHIATPSDTWCPGDWLTVILRALATEGLPDNLTGPFYSADLLLFQTIDVRDTPLAQTRCFSKVEGVDFLPTSSGPNAPPRAPHLTGKAQSVCELHCRIPVSVIPSCIGRLLSVTYFAELRVIYKAQRLVIINFPIRIVTRSNSSHAIVEASATDAHAGQLTIEIKNIGKRKRMSCCMK